MSFKCGAKDQPAGNETAKHKKDLFTERERERYLRNDCPHIVQTISFSLQPSANVLKRIVLHLSFEISCKRSNLITKAFCRFFTPRSTENLKIFVPGKSLVNFRIRKFQQFLINSYSLRFSYFFGKF